MPHRQQARRRTRPTTCTPYRRPTFANRIVRELAQRELAETEAGTAKRQQLVEEEVTRYGFEILRWEPAVGDKEAVIFDDPTS